MFPQLCKTFCLYSYQAYFILPHKSEERVTERNKRLKLWSLFINWETQFSIPADWIIENDCAKSYAWFLNFLLNEECLNCFWQPNVLPKLSKVTDTYQKSVKMNK